jgi:hypothetical protein
MQALYRRQDILAKPALVGKGRAFFVDATIDASAEMLDDLTEDHRIHSGADLIGVDMYEGQVITSPQQAGGGQSAHETAA